MKQRKVSKLAGVIAAHKRGKSAGLYSVCSANPYVLEAAMRQAGRRRGCVCIEATSNQVNQFGGYSGITPAEFAGLVAGIAAKTGLSAANLILGGDHLGPNPWRKEPVARAMEKAREMVRAYVRAGFGKIHLDASMPLGGEDGERPYLDDAVVAERAADLCAAAESAAAESPGVQSAPHYIIGTEVPKPGGAREILAGVETTDPAAAKATIEVTRRAFAARGLEAAWERVLALVVQPGVEFGDASIIPYERRKAARLSAFIAGEPRLVYEAHSTDYQSGAALRMMVEDHFAILKVGPEMTFAFREAVFALAMIEEELFSTTAGAELSKIREVLDRVMVENPGHWEPYYRGSAAEIALARKYSFSDRSRYYWSHPDVREAMGRLMANMEGAHIPLTLLSQYLPQQYPAVAESRLTPKPSDLIIDKIGEVAAKYSYACGS